MYHRSLIVLEIRIKNFTGYVEIWVAFCFSVLAGPTSQLLNETHEFSELVLARLTPLMDKSRSVFSLRLAKARAREFGEFWREKCTRAPWTFPLKLARTSSSRPARTDTWKATEVWTGKMKFDLVLLLKICYGLTETSPVTTQSLTDDPVDLRVSTVGRAHPNVEVRHVTLALYS